MVGVRRIVAITLAIFVVALLAFTVGTLVMTTHRTGGCNHIPLVNGQPAYHCDSMP